MKFIRILRILIEWLCFLIGVSVIVGLVVAFFVTVAQMGLN